jgi:Bifunctional DNA primase/polymerase, N-terminal
MSDRFHEGLRYRRYGLSPIPFHRHAKIPALAEGEIVRYREKPASTAQLHQWFDDDTFNIGLVTGYGGLVVLDVDGEVGRQSLKGLPLPTTPMVHAKRGPHAYFRTNRPYRTRITALPGLDILARDWQVLAPPRRPRVCMGERANARQPCARRAASMDG